MTDAITKLFAKACPYCAKGWPIDDGDDGVPRNGRYHMQEAQYSTGKFGGGFVECKAADERAALAAAQAGVTSDTVAYQRGFDQGGAIAADAWKEIGRAEGFAAGIEAAAKVEPEPDVACVADAKNVFQEGYSVGFNDCVARFSSAIRALRPATRAESEAEADRKDREVLGGERGTVANESYDVRPLSASEPAGAEWMTVVSNRTATVVIPAGYRDAAEFAKDCEFELAKPAEAPSEEDVAREIYDARCCHKSDLEAARAVLALLQRTKE